MISFLSSVFDASKRDVMLQLIAEPGSRLGEKAYGQELDTMAPLPVHYYADSGKPQIMSTAQDDSSRILNILFCTVAGTGNLSVFLYSLYLKTARGS